MIKNVVFDIGNVLYGFAPAKIIDTLIPESVHKDFYLKHLFQDPIWHRMDRGDVSLEGAISHLNSIKTLERPQEQEIATLISKFPLHLSEIKTSHRIFKSLRPTYKVFLLSNFQAQPFETLLEANPFLKNVDGMVVSARINHNKPEPEIYDYLIDTYKIVPEESVFIDDLEANINAAEKKGIKGIHFKSEYDLPSQLEHFGISLS